MKSKEHAFQFSESYRLNSVLKSSSPPCFFAHSAQVTTIPVQMRPFSIVPQSLPHREHTSDFAISAPIRPAAFSPLRFLFLRSRSKGPCRYPPRPHGFLTTQCIGTVGLSDPADKSCHDNQFRPSTHCPPSAQHRFSESWISARGHRNLLDTIRCSAGSFSHQHSPSLIQPCLVPFLFPAHGEPGAISKNLPP